MREFLFWTCVVGGTPLALALVLRALDWLREAIRSGMVTRTPAAGEPPKGDSWHVWTHA